MNAQRGSPTVVYVLSAYPVVSQTFVRNEIMSLRRAGWRVEVETMGRGDRETMPAAWSGPYRAMTDTPLRRAVLDCLWWAVRPKAVLRLLRALVTARFAVPSLLFRGVASAARALSRQDITVVHTHFGWRAVPPALYMAALLGVPATITVHAADIFMPSPRLAGRLRAMHRVVTVCRSNVEYVTALGVDPASVSVVPCGVDVEVVVEPVTRPGHVVSVGRLVPKKGFDVLLDAFARVLDDHPAARLTIIGDGPEREALAARIEALGIGGQVEMTGVATNDEVLRRVVEAEVFALACRRLPNGDSDAMPVAIREAMVRGRPVVSTAVAGIPESVDAEVGWLVASEDVGALATALHEALSDPVETARRGAAGRARVVATASLDASAVAMSAVWAPPGQVPAG